MKRLSVLALLFISAPSFSAVVSKDLLAKEIKLAIRLSDKYQVPLQGDDVCSKTEFEIVSRVTGFNPANWKLVAGRKSNKLTSLEIKSLIAMVDRVGVPLVEIDPITTETRLTVIGESCGFSPNHWTISFEE